MKIWLNHYVRRLASNLSHPGFLYVCTIISVELELLSLTSHLSLV